MLTKQELINLKNYWITEYETNKNKMTQTTQKNIKSFIISLCEDIIESNYRTIPIIYTL